MSFQKTASLVSQAIQVVCYLHTGPRVCHRDLKPENFIVNESPDGLRLKLTDFDLAVVVQSPTTMCRTSCGTMPFTAPEVVLDREYDGMAADIWSIAIVLFEVHCGGYVIEQCMDFKQEYQAGGQPRDSVLSKIRHRWLKPGTPGIMLEERCLQELQPLLNPMRPLINGALHVDPKARWKAAQVQNHMEGFKEMFDPRDVEETLNAEKEITDAPNADVAKLSVGYSK
jgi:serine/threonine protein kinase